MKLSKTETEEKSVFVVIDMQNDFITGSLANKDAAAQVDAIAARIAQERQKGTVICYTRDTHTEDYLETDEGKALPVRHCIKGTHGWQIADALTPHEGDIVIDKPHFGYTQWDKHFAQSAQWDFTLCGTCTDICVVSNALILKAYGFPVRVVSSLCSGTSHKAHLAALDTMRSCQVTVL